MTRYGDATYSPDDNKLRLYPLHRLTSQDYARAKALGFSWAPKQELFVAPMWTPAREDLLIEWCGEIGDDDRGLVDRAEERADRFEGYSEKRGHEAERARVAVAAIADNIPLGQPILVGHHSERHARRDAERIETGMRKAVHLWRTSKYWTARAAGAVRAAKYKERADVRARRIKTIEADRRRHERSKSESDMWLKLWTACEAEPDADLQAKVALRLAGMCDLHMPRKEGDKPDWAYTPTAYDCLTMSSPTLYAPRTLAEVFARAKEAYPANIADCDRWLEHCDNRLLYERAMLEEQGATALLAPKPRRVQLPLLNYRAPNGSITMPNKWSRGELITYRQMDMTKAEYAAINGDYKATREVGGSHRIRSAMVKHSLYCIFLTDAKVDEVPPQAEPPHPATAIPDRPMPVRREPVETSAESGFEAMAASLKAGVKVVVADQLFPTPPDLAARMVDLARIHPDHVVLEPSAGTGELLKAIGNQPDKVAVEISPQLVAGLTRCGVSGLTVHEGDFLELAAGLPTVDRVVMNPPFANAVDIRHILAAHSLLKPGGRLVAICAGGPRQAARLQPMASTWEELPAGTFAGTGVHAVLLTIDKPA